MACWGAVRLGHVGRAGKQGRRWQAKQVRAGRAREDVEQAHDADVSYSRLKEDLFRVHRGGWDELERDNRAGLEVAARLGADVRALVHRPVRATAEVVTELIAVFGEAGGVRGCARGGRHRPGAKVCARERARARARRREMQEFLTTTLGWKCGAAATRVRRQRHRGIGV